MRLLYYKHPALVKPSLPALKPLRPLQVLCGLSPSGRSSSISSLLKFLFPVKNQMTVRPCFSPSSLGPLRPWAAPPCRLFPSKRKGNHEALPKPPSPDCQTARHPHDIRATAAACPQHGHAHPSAGGPLHS